MSNSTIRVFSADLSKATAGTFGPLRGAIGFSGRAETRMARLMREVLRETLHATVVDAFRQSHIGRTGKSERKMLAGVRSFGQRFGNLRGHIMGPSYIKAHEDGSTILPRNAHALAIPLPAALRADGTPKLPGPNSWRNIGTFLYKSKKTGKLYIAYKSAGGSLVLLYVLVDSVTLSKHTGFISKAWNLNKRGMFSQFGQIMMLELSRIDLGPIARVSSKVR